MNSSFSAFLGVLEIGSYECGATATQYEVDEGDSDGCCKSELMIKFSMRFHK